jgi:hypothetical protein
MFGSEAAHEIVDELAQQRVWPALDQDAGRRYGGPWTRDRAQLGALGRHQRVALLFLAGRVDHQPATYPLAGIAALGAADDFVDAAGLAPGIDRPDHRPGKRRRALKGNLLLAVRP